MSVCPQHCITMEPDSEGFLYPEVDTTCCNNCGLCEQTCPVLISTSGIFSLETDSDMSTLFKDIGSELIPQPISVYGAYHHCLQTRVDSTSGGVFSALAEVFFESGGCVAGAVYNKDHSVSHIVTDNVSRLVDLRSSKYLQSFTDQMYRDVKILLDSGTRVLVCGTPCQINGLHGFLRKDYENLVTCDFICKGVNSPLVFKKYMDMLERKYRSKAKVIKFKDKTHGWHRFSMRVDFENGKRYCQDRYHDPFFVGYLQSGNFVRPSCYECRFKGSNRKSDITLADFWGIDKLDVTMDQDLGTSLVLINTQKGARIYREIQSKVCSKQFQFEDAIKENSAFHLSLKNSPRDRSVFFSELNRLPFEKVAKKFFPLPTIKRRLYVWAMSKYVKIRKLRQFVFNTGLSFSTWRNVVYYNFISKNVTSKMKVPFRFLNHCTVDLRKGAKVVVNAKMTIGVQQVRNAHLETRILVEEGGVLTVNGPFTMYAGSYIRVLRGGNLVLNAGFINEGVQITCKKRVTIGKGCAIARDVIIRDYDAHQLLGDGNKVGEEISIGDHVWIGTRAIILKGVTIYDGAVIAAGAVVPHDVSAKCLVAGVPAKVIRELVEWR